MTRSLDPVRDVFDPTRSRYFPADPDALVGYRERFPATARVFERFLRQCPNVRSGAETPHVGIVVMPWFGTSSPWYAIALGLGLARRGHRVTFVWHDLPFAERRWEFERQNSEIRRVLRTLRGRFPIVRVSEQLRAPRTLADEALIGDLADQNLTWSTRGDTSLRPYERDLAATMRDRLSTALPHVRTVVAEHRFDAVVVSGGVLLSSGLYMGAAQEHGTRTVTFDAGFGWTVVCTDGVAAQHWDLVRSFHMLPDEPGASPEAITAAARAEFELRRRGVDATSYQHTAFVSERTEMDSGPGRTVLIPLSVVFDTAALGRHHLFSDSREWLVDTITAVLRNTDDPVVVRQHPSERRLEERSRFDARTVVADAFGSVPQVRFLPAEDPTNTYDLLDESRLVLPFVSTIGIEAAALGKPVVVGGSVYYAALGFVHGPDTREAYLETVARGARGELRTLPSQEALAWRCYYLNAVCRRVWTDFTCQPPDYWRWVRRSPDELYTDPDVDEMLQAIIDDVPLPILRHRRMQSAR